MTYVSFSAIYFCFQTPFFNFGPVFRGHAEPTEKNQLHLRMKNFMLSILKKKKNISKRKLFWKLGRSWKLLVRFEPICKIGSKLPPGASPGDQHKILTEPIIGTSTRRLRIHKFQGLYTCRSRLYLSDTPIFWLLDPIGPNFVCFWAVTPVNKVRF